MCVCVIFSSNTLTLTLPSHILLPLTYTTSSPLPPPPPPLPLPLPLCALQLLKILNSNTENPYLIWDNRTRAELTKYLEEQQQSIVRTVRSYRGDSNVLANRKAALNFSHG